MNANRKLARLADDLGQCIVLYVDRPSGCSQLIDLLTASNKRSRQAVRLNTILLLAWGTMKQGAIVFKEFPAAAQLLTDRLCETIYRLLGKPAEELEPFLYDRWTMFSDCWNEKDSNGLLRLSESFDATCGDLLPMASRLRQYSMNLQLHFLITNEFAAFCSAVREQMMSKFS
jgi:hypothetical protein